MQMRRAQLPQNSYRQRLATARSASALHRIFFSIFSEENRANAKSLSSFNMLGDRGADCPTRVYLFLIARFLVERVFVRRDADFTRHIGHVNEGVGSRRRLPASRGGDDGVALLLGIIEIIGAGLVRPIRVWSDLHQHGPQIAFGPFTRGTLLKIRVSCSVIKKANRY